MITTIKPHFLLFCEGTAGQAFGFPEDDASRWRFVLENVENGLKTEAWDHEPILHPDRISLMAVIRGLEALDQPSKVTLITTNRYVARGLQYGLVEWRENDFCWEHFGSIQPIRNQDLWRRVDIALRYHEVTCRWMAYDSQQDPIDGDRRDVPVETSTAGHYPSGNGARVESRPFSAMLAPPEAIRSLQTVQVASAGYSAPSDSNDSHDSKDPRGHMDAQETSSRIDWSGMPGRWIWRLVLRTDSLLVDTLRSMLMLDPKPDRFRARH
jgi:ribonuclease HI